MNTDLKLAKLTQLELTNFRAFSSVKLDFAPITLLTGANSSGKSSVLSAIASVLQTRSPNMFPFELTPNGSNCSLGGFKDIVHGGNSRSQFGIQLNIEKNKSNANISGIYRYSPSGDHILPAKLDFSVDKNTLNIEWEKTSKHYKANFTSNFLTDQASMSMMMEAIRAVSNVVNKDNSEEKPKKRTKQKLEEPHELYQKSILEAREKQGKWFELKATNPADIRSEIYENIGSKEVINNLQAVIKDLWSQFTYIGPVRAYPERHYALVERGSPIDPRGELSLLELMKWKRTQPKLFNEVSSLLADLELAESIQPDSSTDEIMHMLVKPKGHKRLINYADTGFGISQILPILIKDVALGLRGTILINQPEVHLHPSAQAQLANHFANRINKRRFIIETHSEYMINRFRLLVASGKMDPKDIAIYYFDIDGEGKSIQHRIEILPNGNLFGAPKAYFNTYSVDAMSLINSGFDTQ